MSGGFLPAAARGRVRDQYIHCADWYPTLCMLAGGLDCRDVESSQRRDVPAVDGYDVWDYVTGVNRTSPRTEFIVSRCEVPVAHNLPLSKDSPQCAGAYIKGDFKLVVGMQYYGFWQGPVYPNGACGPRWGPVVLIITI